MSDLKSDDFAALYAGFHAPIAELDCGHKCAPYNERGVPFCCDTHHTVPTAYQVEWAYLQANTNLWHPWEQEDSEDYEELRAETPEGQVLISCLGHKQCQRGFRTITCRAFPFFPYLNSNKELLGLSYYWEYEDRCWVISDLLVVNAEYQCAFINTYEGLLASVPEEIENFSHHSAFMRREFVGLRRAIPLLHRNGYAYKISPQNERMRRVKVEELPKHGPYKIAAAMPFPDETD